MCKVETIGTVDSLKMRNDDAEARADEVTALASIYEKREFFANGNDGGRFSAYVEAPEDFFIELEGLAIQQAKEMCVELVEETNGSYLLPISHLPPIVLNFQYPQDYPSRSAPSFTLSCKWLGADKLSELCCQLDHIWEDNQGEVVIFEWRQFLVDESLQFLGIQSSGSGKTVFQLNTSIAAPGASLDERTDAESGSKDRICISDPRAVQDTASAGQQLRTLIEYDRAERQRVFDASFYDCLVCFCEKAGSDCVNFQGCDHIYCKDCVREYFLVQIREGNVNALNCPDTECDSPAIPSQVRELVGEELFETYDRLLLRRTLAFMKDVAYCPRASCQCPVLTDTATEMAMCSACAFAFCVHCRMAYHGVTPCIPKKEEILGLRMEFEGGDEECKARLERRFGKELFKDIRDYIRRGIEETRRQEIWERETLKNEIRNKKWKDENTKQCPNCYSDIQKVSGCNKMTCVCGVYFCWLCLEILPKQTPYAHFTSDLENPCVTLANAAAAAAAEREAAAAETPEAAAETPEAAAETAVAGGATATVVAGNDDLGGGDQAVG